MITEELNLLTCVREVLKNSALHREFIEIRVKQGKDSIRKIVHFDTESG